MSQIPHHIFVGRLIDDENRTDDPLDPKLEWTYQGLHPGHSVGGVANEFVTAHAGYPPGSCLFVAPAWGSDEPRFFWVREEKRRRAEMVAVPR